MFLEDAKSRRDLPSGFSRKLASLTLTFSELALFDLKRFNSGNRVIPVISNVMYSTRASVRLRKCPRIMLSSRCTYATTAYSTPAPHASRITDTDVAEARKYCSNLLQ
jgi:hypothetical protein